MAFEELREDVDHLHEETKAYIESSMAYYKLWGFKIAVKSSILIAKVLLITLCVLMVILFLSLAAGIWLGGLLDSYAMGFLVVAGFYILTTVSLFLIRDRLISSPLLARFSEIFFHD